MMRIDINHNQSARIGNLVSPVTQNTFDDI